MADPFVAEIRVFPFNFAPRGWAQCNGQIMAISQNTALFSLLGTTYGGDGKSNFALPNLQAQAPLHTDQYSGPGRFPLGSQSGEASVTLLASEMPGHNHGFEAGSGGRSGDVTTPTNGALSNGAQGDQIYSTAAPSVAMSSQALAVAGGSQPHNNLMPYLTLNFCIAMQGIYPPRS